MAWLGSSISSLLHENDGVLDPPMIKDDEPLVDVLKKLSRYDICTCDDTLNGAN